MSPDPSDPALLHSAPKAKPRMAQPGELLFEFYRERDHTRWRCELRDHGETYGVEAQFFRNEEFMFSRRFDPRLGANRPSRELATQWAHEEWKVLEAYDGACPTCGGQGVICSEHPQYPWPHEGCLGPGKACPHC